MQYMLLIYGSEERWAGASDDEREAVYAEYEDLSRRLQERGALVGGAELQPTSVATTIRPQSGETIVTDGPFVETKEALGGYFLIEVESLDEAIEWARQIPAARHGAVELRPVVMRPAEVGA